MNKQQRKIFLTKILPKFILVSLIIISLLIFLGIKIFGNYAKRENEKPENKKALRDILEKLDDKKDTINISNQPFTDSAANINTFEDKDFDINFENPYVLRLKTSLKNPFNEIIESSSLSLRIILEYRKGTFSYKLRPKHGKSFYFRNHFDLTEFYKNKSYTKDDIDKYKAINTASNGIENYKDISPKTASDYRKQLEELRAQYGEDEMRLKDAYLEFDNDVKEKFENREIFNGYGNKLLNNEHDAYFHLFDDFEREESEISEYLEMPNKNLFKANKVILEVFVKASNTNGFYFNKKVKTLNLTENWNSNVVIKDNKKP